MFYVVMVAFDVIIVKNLVNCCQLKIQKGVLLLLNSVKVKLSVHHQKKKVMMYFSLMIVMCSLLDQIHFERKFKMLYCICWVLSTCAFISTGRKYAFNKDMGLTNSLSGWCHFSECGSHSSTCMILVVFLLSSHLTAYFEVITQSVWPCSWTTSL